MLYTERVDSTVDTSLERVFGWYINGLIEPAKERMPDKPRDWLVHTSRMDAWMCLSGIVAT